MCGCATMTSTSVVIAAVMLMVRLLKTMVQALGQLSDSVWTMAVSTIIAFVKVLNSFMPAVSRMPIRGLSVSLRNYERKESFL